MVIPSQAFNDLRDLGNQVISLDDEARRLRPDQRAGIFMFLGLGHAQLGSWREAQVHLQRCISRRSRHEHCRAGGPVAWRERRMMKET